MYYSKALNNAERNCSVQIGSVRTRKGSKLFSTSSGWKSVTSWNRYGSITFVKKYRGFTRSTAARWKTILYSHDFELVHLLSKQNAIADTLSRKLDSVPNTPTKAKAAEKT